MTQHSKTQQNLSNFLTVEAMSFLCKKLKNQATGLEFGGSPESTKWLLDRVNKLYTFTSKPEITKNIIDTLSVDHRYFYKWRLYYVYCNWDIDHRGKRKGESKEDSKVPDHYKLENEIDFCPDVLDQIDFIIVDGALRYRALKRAIRIMERVGSGIVVVNNTELLWREESISRIIPKHWDRHDFFQVDNIPDRFSGFEHNGKWITTVWVVK